MLTEKYQICVLYILDKNELFIFLRPPRSPSSLAPSLAARSSCQELSETSQLLILFWWQNLVRIDGQALLRRTIYMYKLDVVLFRWSESSPTKFHSKNTQSDEIHHDSVTITLGRSEVKFCLQIFAKSSYQIKNTQYQTKLSRVSNPGSLRATLVYGMYPLSNTNLISSSQWLLLNRNIGVTRTYSNRYWI